MDAYYDAHYLHDITFCLIIIFFLKDTLRSSEIDEAERSSNDIANLFHSKSLSDISALI